jgi:hypothetical protein
LVRTSTCWLSLNSKACQLSPADLGCHGKFQLQPGSCWLRCGAIPLSIIAPLLGPGDP